MSNEVTNGGRHEVSDLYQVIVVSSMSNEVTNGGRHRMAMLMLPDRLNQIRFKIF